MAVERHLFRKGYARYVLDGDNVRTGLNRQPRLFAEDRLENIRRVGELAALFADAGFICITAFISPFMADRARARAAAAAAFHEIYINADLATCEQRDPKGLYRRARDGEIAEFTGITSLRAARRARSGGRHDPGRCRRLRRQAYCVCRGSMPRLTPRPRIPVPSTCPAARGCLRRYCDASRPLHPCR